MLKKPYRLKSPALFKASLNTQRLCVNRCFIAFALKPKIRSSAIASTGVSNPARPVSVQFGIIVSKKVHKRAVKRNRIKRQLREIIRTVLLPLQLNYEQRLLSPVLSSDRPEPPFPNPLPFRTVVFVVRASALNVSYKEFKQHVLNCFRLQEASVLSLPI
jgi:ribonuclease P protein component